jgi:hypothetical protein
MIKHANCYYLMFLHEIPTDYINLFKNAYRPILQKQGNCGLVLPVLLDKYITIHNPHIAILNFTLLLLLLEN